MAKSIACADLGYECPGAFVLETEDEILEHVALHVKRVHPDTEMNDETVAALKGAMKTV